MTENEQIQEMARILAEDCEQKSPRDCMNAECADCRAKAAYKAGYRKVERGEWKYHSFCKVKCSRCGIKRNWMRERWYNFCPRCGADMRKAVMAELLPCKCGGKPIVWRTYENTYVECENYNYKNHRVIFHAKTDKEAFDLWNTRTPKERGGADMRGEENEG